MACDLPIKWAQPQKLAQVYPLWCFLPVNTLGSSFGCLMFLLLRALSFKQFNDKHLQLCNVLPTPSHITVCQPPSALSRGMKLTQCLYSRPFLRSLTHPRRQCFRTVLHAFSSPPLKAKVHTRPFRYPTSTPGTEVVCCLCLKGSPILTASVT